MIHFSALFALAMLPVQLCVAETDRSAAVTKESFLAAMRSSKALKDDRERKLRLHSSIMAAATPRKQLEEDFRELVYYGDDTYSNYGFDISSYSLKYAGCSAISTYSDELAQDEDATTVFDTQQYVIFRFCPSNKCQEKSTYGCMSDYGEYMVPIATWLDIMKDYRDEEFQRYCEYCQTCAQNNRKLEDGYYNAANDDGNAAAATDDGNNNSNTNYCAYSSDCSGYQNVCNYDAGVDYSKFFECKEFDVSDDFTLYIGPHCAKDKTTIVLGAFTDDACTKYAGNKYDLGTLTGMKLTSSDLEQYYTSDCIPCKESNLPFRNVGNDYYDNDDISELCENLYGYAAKCNRYIGGHTSKSYQSYQQEDTEFAVCSFIASVVTGTYDEYGYIYVDPTSFESDNKYNQYSKIGKRKGVTTKSQIFGLTAFTIALAGMSAWVFILHNQIKTKSSMRNLQKPLEVDRHDSGIMLARSMSHDSEYDAPEMM